MYLLLWWSCWVRYLFFTSYGLAWSTASRPASMVLLIVRLVLARIGKWGAHTHTKRQEPTVCGIQTQFPTVSSPALYRWAIPLSHFLTNHGQKLYRSLQQGRIITLLFKCYDVKYLVCVQRFCHELSMTFQGPLLDKMCCLPNWQPLAGFQLKGMCL